MRKTRWYYVQCDLIWSWEVLKMDSRKDIVDSIIAEYVDVTIIFI